MMDAGNSPDSGNRRQKAAREALQRDLARLLGEEQTTQLRGRRDLPPGNAAELLADRRLNPETIRFLFGLPGWNTDYQVKAAMALHPRCPLSLLRVLINALRLSDLVAVMTSREIPRAGTRMAADLLGKKLPETPLGRKIQLSRTGGREVHEQLLRDPDPGLLRFLLTEGLLLTEGDLVKLLRDPKTTAAQVALVAAAERWNSRYQLRLELARHRLTPDAGRRQAVSALMLQDLQALLDDQGLSPEVLRLLYTVLRQRISEMSDEEQSALALSGPGRRTVNLLLACRREPVLVELLRRDALDAAQCLALANDPESPAAVLCALARMEAPPGGREAIHDAMRINPALPTEMKTVVGPPQSQGKRGPDR